MLNIKHVLILLMLLEGASAQGPGPNGRGAMRTGAGPGLRGPGVRFLGAQAARPGPIVTGAPFSADAVTSTTQWLPNGNKIEQTSTTKMYRDSQGRTRREPALNVLSSAAPGGSVPQLAFISDPVAGLSYVLDLAGHNATKSTLRAPPNRPNRGPRARADSANVKTESLGRQLVSGVPADGTRTTLTIPAGQIGNAQDIQVVSETWYSPDLQLTVLSKRSDPRSGDSIFQLNNLSRAEPPSTLFEPPGDFQITEQTRGPRMRNRVPGPTQ